MKMRSKKGFTLVELVVVIAILAILAAIAIPAIVGIINSAGESAGESEAQTISQACRTYYAGVKGGSINTNTFTPTKCSDNIPNRADSPTIKRQAAKQCTVAGALEYSGIYDKLIGEITDFGYDSAGDVYFIPPIQNNANYTVTAFKADASDKMIEMNIQS